MNADVRQEYPPSAVGTETQVRTLAEVCKGDYFFLQIDIMLLNRLIATHGEIVVVVLQVLVREINRQVSLPCRPTRAGYSTSEIAAHSVGQQVSDIDAKNILQNTEI